MIIVCGVPCLLHLNSSRPAECKLNYCFSGHLYWSALCSRNLQVLLMAGLFYQPFQIGRAHV